MSNILPIGKFEGDRFNPKTWRPQTPTTAYMEMRDDDAFWAARRVLAFSDEMIRAAVHTGEFSDSARRGTSRSGPGAASQQGDSDVFDGDQPDRVAEPRRERHADIRQRCGGGGRGATAGRIQVELVLVR